MPVCTLESAVENTQLSRITVPIAATDSDLVDSLQRVRSAATHTLGCLARLGVSGVVWQGGMQQGAALLVLCMHKAVITRVFKALYTEQRALGIVVTPDIRTAVSLKPLSGHQLQIAQNAGSARLLEAAGWQFVGQSTWLKLDTRILLAVPGVPVTSICVRIAIPLLPPAAKVAASGKTFGLQVQYAGSAIFTPFSVALTLNLREPRENDSWTHEQEWRLLQEHVFSSPAATRRACRLLYNSRCLLLPNLAPVYVKSVGARPQDEAAMRDRWHVLAPGLPLPQTLPSTLVLEVSQDADTDSDDAGVWEVPAVCCWTTAGLTDLPAAGTAGPGNLSESVMQQLKTDLESSSFMLWGGQPLALKPASSTFDMASAISVSNACASKPPAPATTHPMPPSQSMSTQPQGGSMGWMSASHCQQPTNSQCTVVGPTTEFASVFPGPCNKDGSTELFPPLPVISSTCWWATGKSCEQVYEAVMSCVTGTPSATGVSSTMAPRVSAIMAQRKELRGQEQERWQGLHGVLSKLVDTSSGDHTTTRSAPKPPPSKQPLPQRAPSICKKPGLHSNPSKPAAAPQAPTLVKKAAAVPTAAAILTGKSLPGKNKASDIVPKATVAKKPKTCETANSAEHQQALTAGQTAGLLEFEHPPGFVANSQESMLASQQVVPKAAVKIASKAAKPQSQTPIPDGTTGQDDTKTGPSRKRAKAADMDIAAVEAKVAAKAAAGALSTLTVPEMQAWLRAHHLAVGGKKADLEARLAAAWSTRQHSTTAKTPLHVPETNPHYMQCLEPPDPLPPDSMHDVINAAHKLSASWG